MRQLILILLLTSNLPGISQDSLLNNIEVKSQSIEYNGGKYNGHMMELNAGQDIVEEAIKQHFKLQGSKAKESKGFLVFRNVMLPSIDPVKPVDAVFKVERKSKKEKEQSIVYLIVANRGDIPEEKVKSSDAARTAGITGVAGGGLFLNSMLPAVRKGVHEKGVSDRMEAVKKEEKKLEGLRDDLADMEKKMKKLEEDIEYNKKAQEKQAAEVTRLKAQLEEHLAKNPLGTNL